MKCSACQFVASDSDAYCSKCGAALPKLPVPSASPTEVRVERRHKWLNSIVPVLSAFVFYVLVQAGVSKFGDAVRERKRSETFKIGVQEGVAEAAAKINAKAPYFLDSDTRVDGAVAREGEIEFSVTLVRFPQSTAFTNQHRAALSKLLIDYVCGDGDRRTLLAQDIKLKYDFRALDGAPLASFDVSASNCK